MSKKCRRCGHLNEDKHFFCQGCGEALDDDVRLIMSYEKMKKSDPQKKQTAARQDQDDDYTPVKRVKEKKSYTVLWIAAVAVCLVVAAYFLLSH